MAINFSQKRKVVEHRRYLQDSRFRPFMKRQWRKLCDEIYPVIKGHIVAKLTPAKLELCLILVVTVLVVASVNWARA